MNTTKIAIEDFASTEKRVKRKTFIDDGPNTDDSNVIDFNATTNSHLFISYFTFDINMI